MRRTEALLDVLSAPDPLADIDAPRYDAPLAGSRGEYGRLNARLTRSCPSQGRGKGSRAYVRCDDDLQKVCVPAIRGDPISTSRVLVTASSVNKRIIK